MTDPRDGPATMRSPGPHPGSDAGPGADIVRIEAWAVALDHHYRVAGTDHRPGSMRGTPYYLEPAWSQVYSTQAMTALVRVTTRDGVRGWGEVQAPIAPEVVVTLVERLLGPALLGRRVGDPALERDRLAGLMLVRGHSTGFFADTVAGLDIALWDVVARRAGIPLATMLGGDVEEPLPLYVSGLRRPTLAEQADAAATFVDAGYGGLKMFLSGPPETMASSVDAIRVAVGPDPRLMVDLLWGQELGAARRLLELLLARGTSLEFLEAPLPLEPVADHARLAETTSVPLAAGEHLHTTGEAEALVANGVRVVQPDVARTGVTQGRRIARRVRELGAEVTWHVGTCSPVAMAASWAMALSAPVTRLQEHQADLLAAMGQLVEELLPVDRGVGRLRDVPGLGVEVDVEALRAVTTTSCDVRA